MVDAQPQSQSTDASRAGGLSVVIVNWNGVGLLQGCLDPLEGAGFEVIVVDNASSDGSLTLLAERYPWVSVIANPDNRGFAAANNQGIERAAAPAVLLLNSDTVPDPVALHDMAGFLSAHPEVGVVGPTLVWPDGRRQPSCGPGPTLWTELLSKSMLHRLLPGVRERAPLASCRVDWVTGAALCIRRQLALDLGGLDEEMFMFYEDLELCARVRDARSEVWFVSTAPVVHIGGASRRRVEAQSLVHSYRSSQHFFARHGPPWRRTLVRAMTVPEAALRAAVWAPMLAHPGRRAQARERLRAYGTIMGLALTRRPR